MRLMFTWKLVRNIASSLISYPNLSEGADRVGGTAARKYRVSLQWRKQFRQFGGRCRKTMLGV